MDIIKSIEHEQLKNKIPELKVGNTVRVHVRIKEGNKERIQVFEGIIIKVQGGGCYTFCGVFACGRKNDKPRQIL